MNGRFFKGAASARLGGSGDFMTLSRTFGFLLLAALALAACEDKGGEVWNASQPWSVTQYHVQNAYDFAEAVHEASGGALKIRVFPNAVLGLKGPESIRALEEGLVDMAEMPAFQEAGTEPVLGLESLPFLIEDQQELRLLYTFSRPAIEAAFARHRLKVLYIVPWPRQNIYTKRPVETLADLRGLKIRTYDRNTSRLMERLGMVPLQMPSQDVVPALASGMIDAVMTSTTTGAAQRYWEFLPTIVRTNHVWITNIMAVRRESWDALPEETRDAIENLLPEMEQRFWQVAAEDDQKKLEILLNNGMQVIEPTEELLNDMRARATPMWRQYREDAGAEAAAILDAFLAATGREDLP